MQADLKNKLDQAFRNNDYAEITLLISNYLDQVLPFRPGFSDFSEIVIDYLVSGMFSTPLDHLQHRYEITEKQAVSLYDTLKLFAAYRE